MATTIPILEPFGYSQESYGDSFDSSMNAPTGTRALADAWELDLNIDVTGDMTFDYPIDASLPEKDMFPNPAASDYWPSMNSFQSVSDGIQEAISMPTHWGNSSDLGTDLNKIGSAEIDFHSPTFPTSSGLAPPVRGTVANESLAVDIDDAAQVTIESTLSTPNGVPWHERFHNSHAPSLSEGNSGFHHKIPPLALPHPYHDQSGHGPDSMNTIRQDAEYRTREKPRAGSFICAHCDHRADRRCDLNRHVKRKHKDRAHRCSFAGCQKAFLWPKDLRRHVESMHRDDEPGNRPSVYGASREPSAAASDQLEVEPCTACLGTGAVATSARHRPDQGLGGLHPEYRLRANSRKFFAPGRVFLILWAEPANQKTSAVASETPQTVSDSNSRFDTHSTVVSKIRRFVVVREGQQGRQAIPIVSYDQSNVSDIRPQSNGIRRDNDIRSDNNICESHTGRVYQWPSPQRWEKPQDLLDLFANILALAGDVFQKMLRRCTEVQARFSLNIQLRVSCRPRRCHWRHRSRKQLRPVHCPVGVIRPSGKRRARPY